MTSLLAHTNLFLAAATDFSEGADTFWDTGFGTAVGNLLAALGVLIIVIAGIRSIGDVTSGKIGSAVKKIVGALIFGGLLLTPAVFADVGGLFGDMFGSLIDSFGEVADF